MIYKLRELFVDGQLLQLPSIIKKLNVIAIITIAHILDV